MRASLVQGFRIGDWVVEPMLSRIAGPSGSTHVEPRAMDVLVALAQRAGEIVSRDDLILAVWKHPHVTDEALSRCVSILRHALGDDQGEPRFLETVRKRGYRLIPLIESTRVTSPEASVSIGVLPFLNLSGDPGDEHLAAGVTELLITNLALLPGLRVTSRTSSMHYKGSHARIADIARELDVSRIIEGSVLRSGSELQVIVQLIDPAVDAHLFTRSYTRTLGAILRLQNEIAWTIAGEVGTTLRPEERDLLPHARPLREDALQAYLRARHFWAQRTPDALAKAHREYAACIESEPDFAPAYAGLVNTRIVQAFYGVVPAVSLRERTRALAERAAALDPTGAESLTAQAGMKLFFDWDFDASEPKFRAAVAANGSFDVARLGLGDNLMFRGRFDEAMQAFYPAVRMNPFDLGLQMNWGDFLLYSRRYDDAVTQLRNTLEIGPHFWPARCRLAEALALLGDRAGAMQQLERATEDIPVARLHEPQMLVHAVFGERDVALALLTRLEAERARAYVPQWAVACGYALLGDIATALHWIDRGIEERAPTMLLLGIHPAFDGIREDERFVERLHQIGLPA